MPPSRHSHLTLSPRLMLSVAGWKRMFLSTTVWVVAERAVDAAAQGSAPAIASASAEAAARADAAATRACALPVRRSGERTVTVQGRQLHQRRCADADSRH